MPRKYVKRRPPEYVLRVRPLKDPADPRGIRRVRLGLKRMLRALRIRCVEIRENESE